LKQKFILEVRGMIYQTMFQLELLKYG